MKLKGPSLLFLVVVALSVTILSCNPNDNDSVSTLAKVMVINASPSTDGLDFYIENELQNGSPLTYGFNTPYYQSLTGKLNFKLNNSQSNLNLVDVDYNLDLNGIYTYIALDTVTNIQAILLDDITSDPPTSYSKARLIHAAHNTPSIDLINLADSSVLFTDIHFKSHTKFEIMNAGNYDLGYRIFGDTNIASFSTPVVFEANKIYTMFISGYNSDSNGTAISSLDLRYLNN